MNMMRIWNSKEIIRKKKKINESYWRKAYLEK
jgi:hypothetical protein